jgi:hypothetical protein
MHNDDVFEDETPVDQIPGYVGIVFDDFIEFTEGLTPLIGFDFRLYGIMADELDVLRRSVVVDFGSGPSTISFEAHSIHGIVSSIPCIEALYDCPSNQGPAGAAGHIFLLDEGTALAKATACAQSLRVSLDEDFKSLEAQYGELSKPDC